LLLKLGGILVLKRNRLLMNSNCQNCGGYFVSDERGVNIDRFVTHFFFRLQKSHPHCSLIQEPAIAFTVMTAPFPLFY